MIPVRFCMLVTVFMSPAARGWVGLHCPCNWCRERPQSAAASSLLPNKSVFERPSIHQESAQRNAQHKSSNEAAAGKSAGSPGSSPPIISSLKSMRIRGKALQTGVTPAESAQQLAVWFRENASSGLLGGSPGDFPVTVATKMNDTTLLLVGTEFQKIGSELS